MQDLNDMLFFAEVVDRGGFAAAGRALGLPKSRLSRRVADLEARLGVRLLQRTTRKLSLTQAGEIYHRHCVAMREQAEAADEAVARVQTEPRGTVRMTCPVTLAQTTIGPILPRFLAAHPQVRVDMLVTNRVIDLVQEGVDIALRVRTTLDDSGTLVVKNLGPTGGALVASPQLLQRFGQPAAPEELRNLPTVAMSAADGRASWRLVGPKGEEHDVQHFPSYTADDLLTLKFAVLQGTGMCVLPDYMCAEELRKGELVPVLPGWAPPMAQVLAVFPSRRGMVPAIRRLLDFMGESIRGESICPT
ncbi:LysR substrate-binding domain-containing protein [Ramlibacter sp. XY19]|uniref:LysR substrate-binding domain-containing protein n=1 Tax=Ramlibacter paludis TaxID=2908000 RepID=UPI0023DC19A7|nr:LysR substrate-binding domain-containing protein [Ramlibacter paludis]MCG2593324.1 LysR substrate-binding domain-containing protein [Ramlibacter paludis]